MVFRRCLVFIYVWYSVVRLVVPMVVFFVLELHNNGGIERGIKWCIELSSIEVFEV